MEPVVSEDLILAAARYGPQSKEPPYVRAAFPMVALPRVLREFVQTAAEAMGVPPECVATPALATCGWPCKMWCCERRRYLRQRFPIAYPWFDGWDEKPTPGAGLPRPGRYPNLWNLQFPEVLATTA